MRRFLYIVGVPILALVLCLGAGEGLLRLKNASMSNYDIEIWRYGKTFAVDSADPAVGQEQRPLAEAQLQKVLVRTNEWGGRGAPAQDLRNTSRRILFLGGSITFGWGVAEADTLTERLQQQLDPTRQRIAVLNGGVVNYNAQRYVGLFLDRLKTLQPTDIVVHYFMRDIEQLGPPTRNRLLHESELAFTAWLAASRLTQRFQSDGRVAFYRKLYAPDASEFRDLKENLRRLADYRQANNVRIYLAMMPDVHSLQDYQFGFIHDAMRDVARDLGFTYVDLLPALRGLSPSQLWSLPGDPHPNALGHRLMAEELLPMLRREAAEARVK